MLRKLLDVVFWITLAVLFGGTLVLGAVVAPAVFDTTKARNIVLPNITSPPLDATRQAGGEIFGVILQRFAYIEWGALAILALVIVGWLRLAKVQRLSTVLIAALWFVVAALTFFDAVSLTPRVFQVRDQVRNTAAQHLPPNDANWPENQQFDALHSESELIGHLKAYALLGMIAIAAFRGTKPQPAAEPAPAPLQNKLP